IGVLSDDLFALVALLAEAILIVEITVRLRTARELARHEAASAELARREAAFGLRMREELLSFLSTKLQGPLMGMVDSLISARSAAGLRVRAGPGRGRTGAGNGHRGGRAGGPAARSSSAHPEQRPCCGRTSTSSRHQAASAQRAPSDRRTASSCRARPRSAQS